MNIIAKDQDGAKLRTLANNVKAAAQSLRQAIEEAEKAGLRVEIYGQPNLPTIKVVRPQEEL